RPTTGLASPTFQFPPLVWLGPSAGAMVAWPAQGVHGQPPLEQQNPCVLSGDELSSAISEESPARACACGSPPAPPGTDATGMLRGHARRDGDRPCRADA